ncbi:hypothetical protein [Variibacter gotjawalensis]|uniref:hypothetical protein n=1 Tax=Variibacter gotjawalensis TaxID=1333996 RepID=UPI000BBAA137|nr:hypothetical protein [Variibacter gotjawalensis]NIK46093.1 hypothetical protein [Variibacter gotjawalensis]
MSEQKAIERLAIVPVEVKQPALRMVWTSEKFFAAGAIFLPLDASRVIALTRIVCALDSSRDAFGVHRETIPVTESGARAARRAAKVERIRDRVWS